VNIFGVLEREKYPLVLIELIEIIKDMGTTRRMYAKARKCGEAGIPFHQAVREGVPGESIDVAFQYYAKGFKFDPTAMTQRMYAKTRKRVVFWRQF